MTRCLAVLAILLSTASAKAQALQELPEEQALQPELAATLQAAVDAGETLDRLRRWQGDLTDDGQPDLVVQAAIAADDGNAIFLLHWVFEVQGDRLIAMTEIDLPGGIKAVERDGDVLVFTLFKHLPDDPRCCPSGEDQLRIRYR